MHKQHEPVDKIINNAHENVFSLISDGFINLHVLVYVFTYSI